VYSAVKFVPVLLILKVRTYVLQLMKVVRILTMVVILYTHLQLCC